MTVPNKSRLIDVVDSVLIRENDLQGIKRARYMLVAKEIYEETNLHGIKDSKRLICKVDKNTNSIYLPDEGLMFSTIYGIVNGKFQAFALNANISEDIIDLSAHKYCENGCGSQLCSDVKNYELVEENVYAPMPNGSSVLFRKTSRKKINPDGSYIYEITEPVKNYSASGTHISTTLITRTEFICNLDIDDKGCVIENEDNKQKIWSVCGFHNIGEDCGKPLDKSCFCPNLEYNVSTDGKRIILPSNLSLDTVLVRYYYSQKTKDIMIPFVAKNLFRLKLVYALKELMDNVSRGTKIDLERKIWAAENQMNTDLSRLTLSELYDVLSPKKVIS